MGGVQDVLCSTKNVTEEYLASRFLEVLRLSTIVSYFRLDHLKNTGSMGSMSR